MAIKGTAKSISITPPNSFPEKIFFAPGGSKSISNRALLLSVLSIEEAAITGLSTSEDTRIMKSLLQQDEGIYDAGHAGTCFRFMTAYLAMQPGIQVLTGSERMKERPVGSLVEALKTMGVPIKYLGRKGYPPIEIGAFQPDNYNKNVKIRGDVSSQFISALMMIAPKLPEGLQIEIIPPFVSTPYVEMTASMIRDFGVAVEMNSRFIYVPNGIYSRKNYQVETDWSSASYPIGLLALIRKGELTIPGLLKDSLQGDSIFTSIARQWGLKFDFNRSGLLVAVDKDPVKSEMNWDFTNCPDLAPTVIAVNAALGIRGNYTGMQTLRLKESDRIHSMRMNLEKVGVGLQVQESDNSKKLKVVQEGQFQDTENLEIDPFDDHRIAMACGLWAVLGRVTVRNSEVVNKSYPDFWDQMKAAGFTITLPN